MKIEDCKKGMLVIATKKSYKDIPMEDFLGYSPLGIGKISSVHIDKNEVVIFIDGKGNNKFGHRIFSFKPEDLVYTGE